MNEALQRGGSCTIWTAVMNSKLVEHNKIEEVINIRTHQLQPGFFCDVVNNVGKFKHTLVSLGHCNQLMRTISNNIARIVLENEINADIYLNANNNNIQQRGAQADTIEYDNDNKFSLNNIIKMISNKKLPNISNAQQKNNKESYLDEQYVNNKIDFQSNNQPNLVQTPAQNIQHEQDTQPQNIQKTDMQRAQEAAQHMLKNNADIMRTGKNIGVNKVLNKQIQTKQNTNAELTLNNNIF